MGDENEDEEQLLFDEDENLLYISKTSDLVQGRKTLFCCLSCGIPYAFPDDAYLSTRTEAKSMMYFTHYVRKQLRVDDRSRASTLQWLPNECHYLHKFMHKNILQCCLKPTETRKNISDAEEPLTSWQDQSIFLRACNKLIGCCKFAVPAVQPYVRPRLMEIDKKFLDFTSPCCNGCNTAATNSVHLRQLLGIDKPRYKTFALKGVPDPKDLPMGMRTLHDVYLFIYTTGACLSTMIDANCDANISATKCFRLDCLIRLYVGYILYHLVQALNGTTFMGDMSFDHWYVCLLHLALLFLLF